MPAIDADALVASARDHGITLVGPPPADNQWQARTEGAFAIEQFDLDWDRQIATCPAGQTSESWIPDTNCGHDNVRSQPPAGQHETIGSPLSNSDPSFRSSAL